MSCHNIHRLNPNDFSTVARWLPAASDMQGRFLRSIALRAIPAYTCREPERMRRDTWGMVRKIALLVVCGFTLAILHAGCVQEDVPLEQLFPPNVSDLLRTSGPMFDPATSVQVATYQTADSYVLLRVRQVGRENVEHALSVLPPSATIIGPDPALGQRNGTFFNFGNEYHAAWGNGDWVFILSASSEAARINFLAAYGF